MLGPKFTVVIVFQHVIEFLKVNISFNPSLTAVENHQNEDKLSERWSFPLLFDVEVLEDTLNHEVMGILALSLLNDGTVVI